jgi:hypothetical protein
VKNIEVVIDRLIKDWIGVIRRGKKGSVSSGAGKNVHVSKAGRATDSQEDRRPARRCLPIKEKSTKSFFVRLIYYLLTRCKARVLR